MTTLVEARGLYKAFPGVQALDNVSIRIKAGEVHCLVGENGAGKSTLVKVLTGVYKPDAGSVLFEGHDAFAEPESFSKVAYVPQEPSLFMHMTVAENLFMPFIKSGMGRYYVQLNKVRKEAERFIERFQINARPETVVEKLTVSDRQLLQIARASTMQGFKVLFLDEPTTSLTLGEIGRFYNIVEELRDKGCGIVFISHKFDEIYRIGNYTTVMRNGCLAGEGYLRDISQQQLVSMMSGEEINTEERCQPTKKPGEVILEVDNLSGEGFSSVCFNLRQGEVLGVAGLVGAGRSEIMQTVFGYLPEKTGRITFMGQPWRFRDTSYAIAKGLYYLPEERKTQGILPHLSVRMNIGITLLRQTTKALFVSGTREKEMVTDIIRDYNIKTPSMNQLISRLSGGNQQKAIIGRVMRNQPRVIIIDEPTKGIDIKAKAEIYHLLRRLAEEERVGIIMISSELKELMKCANRILVIHHGKVNGLVEVDDTARQNQIVSLMLGVKEST